MKQEYVLNKLYYNVFNIKYNHDDMKHRNNMQLIVYKLQEAGFDVGGYTFLNPNTSLLFLMLKPSLFC